MSIFALTNSNFLPELTEFAILIVAAPQIGNLCFPSAPSRLPLPCVLLTADAILMVWFCDLSARNARALVSRVSFNKQDSLRT